MRTNETTKEAANYLQGRVEEVAAFYLPNGKWKGNEYEAKNPRRQDNRPGSFKLNRNGKWCDFATGEGGEDVLSFIQYVGVYQDAYETIENLPSQFKPENGSVVPVKKQKPVDPFEQAWEYCRPGDSDYPTEIKHLELGKPTEVYEFRDTKGTLIGLRVRFQVETKKEIRPYTLFKNKDTGERKWHWKGLPKSHRYFAGGYPLYGLEKLEEKPGAPILLVEGERTANKAQELFPNFAVLTIYGGCKSVNHAKFDTLREREVYFWADADGAGSKFVADAAELIGKAGGHVRGIVDNEQFLSGRAELPKGYDAADAAEEGFDAKHIENLERAGQLFVAIETAADSEIESTAGTVSEPVPKTNDEYYKRIEGKGVFFKKPDGGSEWLCSDIEILSNCADLDNENWATRVRLTDLRGIVKESVVSFEDIVAGTAIKQLASSGLRVSTKFGHKQKLAEYLHHTRGKDFVRLAPRTGWFGNQNCFVLPGETIGTYVENGEVIGVALCSTYAYHNKVQRNGSLREWQIEIANRAIGNSRLILAICQALAGPLLRFANESSGGIHLIGPSSSGKTTCLRLANSVWTGPEGVGTWYGTANGIAAATAAANDGLLVLDEIGEADKKELTAMVYGIGNATSKKRSNSWGGVLTEQTSSLVCTLSTGETSLRETLLEGGIRTHAGMEIRLLDLLADGDKGLGVFEQLNDASDPNTFATELNVATTRFYGTASLVFIDKCIEHRASLPNLIERATGHFMKKYVPSDATGQVKRVAKRFALIAAAGEFATEWGITSGCEGDGWSQGDATKAVARCFLDWIQLRGGSGLIEEKSLLDQVQYFIERYGESRFALMSSRDSGKRINDRCGYYRENGNLLILSGVFTKEVCTGFNKRFAIDTLIKHGVLVSPSRMEHIPAAGCSKRVYEIDQKIFSHDE